MHQLFIPKYVYMICKYALIKVYHPLFLCVQYVINSIKRHVEENFLFMMQKKKKKNLKNFLMVFFKQK